jgi:SNF2 family DNA or RNA helicase
MEAIAVSPPEGRFAISLSWGLLRLVRDELVSLRLDTIVADEIHYASNPDSQRTQALLWLGTRLWAERRIGLTGTEIRNRPKELWPLLRFLDPIRFRVFERFGERFCGPRTKRIRGRGGKTIKVREYNGASKL